MQKIILYGNILVREHFAERRSEAKLERDSLPNNLFTPKFTRQYFAYGETKVLDLEEALILQVAQEKGLDDRDMLVKFKCALPIREVLQDTVRLKSDIRRVHFDLEKSKNLVLNSEGIKCQAQNCLT